MIYFGILFVLIIINVLNNYENNLIKKFDKELFWGVSSVIFIVAAFRNGIGYDFNSYKNIHFEIYYKGISASEAGVELGYYLINKILPNFALVIFVSAVLCIILKMVVINKFSENKWTSLILYFSSVYIMFDLGVIRQGIAISFAFISIKYILNRDWRKFILCIGIGMLFHVSVLFFTPLYFIKDIKIKKRDVYYLAIGSLIFSFINIREIIESLLWIFPNFVATKIQYYLEIQNTSLTISLIKRIIFLIIFVEAYHKLKIEDRKSVLFLNGYILSIIIMGLGSSLDIIGGRGSSYLYILQIFIFGIIMNRLPSKKLKNVFLLIIVSLSINSMLGPIKEGNATEQPYTPYKSILYKEK